MRSSTHSATTTRSGPTSCRPSARRVHERMRETLRPRIRGLEVALQRETGAGAQALDLAAQVRGDRAGYPGVAVAWAAADAL